MSRDYQDDVCWERARLSEGQKSVRAAYSALSLRNDTYTQSRLQSPLAFCLFHVTAHSPNPIKIKQTLDFV